MINEKDMASLKKKEYNRGTIQDPIRYASPLNDYAFKLLFMDDGSEPRLMSLINSLLNLQGKSKIVELKIVTSEQIPEKPENKKSYVDVKCKDGKGNYFIVEIQRGCDKSFVKRMQYYSAKSLTSQIKSSEKYKNLMPVTIIAIVDKILFPRKKDFINFFKTVDVKTGEHDFNLQNYCTVEIEKYRKHPDYPHHKIAVHCIDMLAYAHQKTDLPKHLENEIKKSYELMERSTWSDSEIEAYDKAEMYRISYQDNMDIRYEEGHAQGHAEGRKQEKLTNACNLLKSGMSLNKIAEVLNLEESEILKLKNN